MDPSTTLAIIRVAVWVVVAAAAWRALYVLEDPTAVAPLFALAAAALVAWGALGLIEEHRS